MIGVATNCDKEVFPHPFPDDQTQRHGIEAYFESIARPFYGVRKLVMALSVQDTLARDIGAFPNANGISQLDFHIKNSNVFPVQVRSAFFVIKEQ